VGRADRYSQPDAPDPVLEPELVLSLARPHLPAGRWVSRVEEVDESGGEARAYLLDGDLVVKTQRPHRLRPRTSLAKEAALLTALAGPLAGRIPTLFGYGQVRTVAGGVELIVMSRVAGRPVQYLAVAPAARIRLIADVGRLLRTVHALDAAAAPVGGLVPVDENWSAVHRRLEWGFADLLEAHAGIPAGPPLPVPAARVAARALAALPTGSEWRPVVLHSNPGTTHVFADRAGAFTGVIDFGDAFLSHPALDLCSWPDPADRVRLREAYLDGGQASRDFDAVWTVTMLYADLSVLAGRSVFAGAAREDLASRLAQL
jgi:hygromycin-B 7''-O-kinase